MILNDIYHILQFGFLFLNGYLVSRLFIACGIADRIVRFFIARSKGKISHIIVYIVFTTSIISMFVPNFVTVLIILPLLELLRKDFQHLEGEKRRLSTSFAMANLYGSNLGGTGSVTGSALNVVFVGFILLKRIEGYNKIDFLSWLSWGFPFVLLVAAIACLLIVYVILPRELIHRTIDFENFVRKRKEYPHQRTGIVLSVASFIFWVLLSSINEIKRGALAPYLTGLAAAYMVFFIAFAFLVPLREQPGGKKRTSVLTFKDLYASIPLKGFLLAVGVVGFSFLLFRLGIDDLLSRLMASLLPPDPSPFLVILCISGFSIFVSEFISNTTVIISLYVIAISICGAIGIHPLPVLLAVTICANSACMTPVASPVNAIAFAGVKGVNIKRMFLSGVLMDMAVVVCVTLLARFVIPGYYRLR